LGGSLAGIAKFGRFVEAAEVVLSSASTVLVEVSHFVFGPSLVLYGSAILAFNFVVGKAGFRSGRHHRGRGWQERVEVTGVVAASLTLENGVHTVTTGHSEAATGGGECGEHGDAIVAMVGFLEDFLVTAFLDGGHVRTKRGFPFADLAVGNNLPTLIGEGRLVGFHVARSGSFDDIGARGLAGGGTGLGVRVANGATRAMATVGLSDQIAEHTSRAGVAEVSFSARVLVAVLAKIAGGRGFGSVNAATSLSFGVLVSSGLAIRARGAII
jgi:hypothetical protein